MYSKKSHLPKNFTTIPLSPHQKIKKVGKIISIISLIFLLLVISLGLFIKLNVAAAAQFTDNVLRPILGSDNVIMLEKIFFNSADKINQFTSKFEKPSIPLINYNVQPSGPAVVTPQVGLDLTPVVSLSNQPLAGEGIWTPVPLSLFPKQTVVEETFIHPDPSRSYALVTLMQFDMSQFKLFSVAGTKEPGGKIGNPGPGVIPASVVASGQLVAAFSGGFQYIDGKYGMIVGDKTYLPLQNDLATLVGYSDGSLKIVKYEGQNFTKNVLFVRQNCPMLVEDGVIATEDPQDKRLWGRTLTSDIYTWRSGIGITKNGNLIYAVGNSLTPSTLAYALKAAGSIDAMQLDINEYWVRFTLFNDFQANKYKTRTLMKGVYVGDKQFLSGYIKDFFYLVKN